MAAGGNSGGGGGNSGGGGGNSGGGNSGGGNTGGGNTGGGNTGGGNTGGGNTGGGNTGGGNTGGGNTGGGNTGGGNNGGGGQSGGGTRDLPSAPSVFFLTSYYTVREGTGKWITVRLSTTFDESVNIPLLVTNGDGVTSEDYSGVPASVVFKPGEATKSFRFMAAADEIFESDEAIDIAFGQLPTGLRSTRPSSATVVIQDRLDEPVVQIGNGLAYENDAEMTFEVNLSLPSSEEVSVRWQTEDGDALAGEDYEAASGVATFAPGLTGPLVVRVPIINDSYSEANETFTVQMSDPKNGKTGSVATGAIIDDDLREVRITPQNLVVQEGQTANYSVVLGSAPTEAVTVVMTTAGETELVLSPGTLVFTDIDWNTPRTIAVGAPADDDAMVEPPVTIQHTVSGGDYDQLPVPPVTVTIAETDFAVVSVADAEAGEGDGEIVFVVELDNATNRTVNLLWETGDRTATASSDYVGGQGQLTFAPLETRRELVFQLIDDELNEAAETFALELGTVTNAVLSNASVTGTIVDDDLVAVGITAAQDRLVEGEPVRFNLARVGDLTVPVVVPIEVSQVGSVIAGTPPTSATFAAGTATAVLIVETENDQLDEPDARVEARLLGGDGHVVNGPESASVTVEDDDLPSVSIVPVANEVREGEAARFSIVRVGQLTEELQVSVEVNQVGEVISGLPPSTVTFALGADVAQLIVETQDDEVDEPDGVVQVRLEEASSYAVSAAGSASVMVSDNDMPIVGLVAEGERVEEGRPARFNVTRVGDLTVPLTIPVEVSQVGEVISGEPPEAVTFAIGADTAVLVVFTEDDSVDGPDGMIEVRIVAGSGYLLSSRSSASIVIADNDLPAISIAAPVATVTEGADVRFDLTRVGQLTEALIVPVVVDQVGDVIEGTPPSSASFAVGSATALVIVETKNDQLDEPDARVEARLLGGDGHVVNGPESASVTVEDDDLPSVSIVPVANEVREGEAARFSIVRVGQLTEELQVSVEVNQVGEVISGLPPSTVTFALGADVAQLIVETQDDEVDEPDGVVQVRLEEASSYAVSAAGSASVMVSDNDMPIVGLVAEGERVEEGRPARFNVTRVGDLTVPLTIPVEVSQVGEVISGEPPEAVTFAIGADTAVLVVFTEDDSVDGPDGMIEVRIVAGSGYLLSSRSSASIVIADNDLPAISIAAPVATVTEGADVRFDLTRVGQLTEALIVPVVVDQVGDVIEGTPPSSASFAVGSAIALVIVTTENDQLDEPDARIEARILGGDGHVVDGPGSASVTVEDDDLPSVSIVPVANEVREGEAARFSIVRVGQLTEELQVSVEVNQVGEVISGLPPSTVTFALGADVAQLIVETQDDEVDEPDGVVQVRLEEASSYAVSAAGSASVMVSDNDMPIVGLVAEGERVEEGRPARFNVTRVGDLTVPLTIPVEVSQVGEVISGEPPEAVTFAIGADTATLVVATEDDRLDEPDGMIEVRIVAGSGYLLSPRSSASIVIADNDLSAISIAAPVATVTEGADVRFDLTRVGQLTEALIVPVVVDQVGDVIEGTPPSSASFAVGSAIAVVIVPTVDDELDEADGVIEVRILPGDDHEVSGESSATVTVTDNDLPSVSIVAVADQVTEGDEARFNVIRVGDLAVALDVPVEVGQTGDVLSGVPPTSVSFPAGADTAVLVVETQDDELDEEDGMVEAALSEGGGHVVAGAGEAMVAVADNDAAPTVTVLGAQALERAGEIVFSVSLGGPSGRTVSVDWATSDGTAIAIDDYGSETGTLVIAPGRMADTIRIAIVDDLLDEENETFSVTLDALVNILPGTVAATGTILDDDLPVAKAWLSRFGRTVATQVVDAVSDRVFRDYGPGGGLVLGGANHADAGWADLITGSSFRYSTVGQVGQVGAPRGWTVWGRGASTRFSGEETEMSLDGGVVSGFVGVDFQQGPLLAGLLLSHSRGDGDYSGSVLDVDGRRLVSGGELGSSLTGVHPYLRVNVTDRIATWGLLGRGWGNMTVSEGGHDTGIGMNLGAVGARGSLLSPGGSGGFGLALKSDAFYTGLNSERSTGGLPAEDVSVNRVRLAVEGSRDMVTGNGTRIGLSVEAGVRRDGGDAETGTGVEMGGRVRYANPQQGLSVEATARGLIAHQNADYEEWGVAGSLLFDPGRSEQGFSMRMRTAWGSVFGGVHQLWSQESVRGLSRGRLRGGNEPEINAELNYGVAIRSDETLVTPFATISLAGGQTAAYRLGWRVKVGPTFRLSLENTIGGDPNRGSLARGLQLRGSFRREQ